MSKLSQLVLIAFCLLVTSDKCEAQTIFSACSQWKPYFFEDKEIIKGSAFNLSKSVLKRAGLKAEFFVQPWKRIYEKALRYPNFMISCLGRTQKREDLFHWIGPVTKGTLYKFYKLKSISFRIEKIEDVLGYSVGVLRGGHQQDFVLGLNHPLIQEVSRSNLLVRILNAKRVELILDAENVIVHGSKASGLDPEQFEVAIEAYTVFPYLALSKKTSTEVVDLVQNAYEELRAEGKWVVH